MRLVESRILHNIYDLDILLTQQLHFAKKEIDIDTLHNIMKLLDAGFLTIRDVFTRLKIDLLTDYT